MDRHLTKLAFLGAALISLGLGTVPVVTDIALARESTTLQAPSSTPLLAQADICRQVAPAVNGLNVRQAPSLSAEVVGVVPGGSSVVLQDTGENGWVAIAEPYQGYVASSYLTNCAADVGGTFGDEASVATSSEMCRQVIVRSGLNVRDEPTVYSDRLTALPTGTHVMVEGPAVDTWTPISEPVDGYVASRFLGDCD
jgi:uncharacterized protein YgiM (DUF1202 family)